MPKPKYIISDFEKELIRHEIFQKKGIKIQTKAHCKFIENEIQQIGGILSESTIYRIFILKNNLYTPYMHSLNVLAEYCGYADWYDFMQQSHNHRKLIHPHLPLEEANRIESMISLSITNREYAVMKKYFLQFEYHTSDEYCHQVGNEIFKTLMTNPKSCLSFYQYFSDVPIIRKSFFELLADPDFELCMYENAILTYLKYTTISSNISYINDYVFANSLLFRYYYLHNKSALFEETGRAIYESTKNIMECLDDIHTFPKARFLVYKVLWLSTMKSKNHQIKYEKWLIHYISEQKESWTYQDSKIWIHTILDILTYIIDKKPFIKHVKLILTDHKHLYPLQKINTEKDVKKLLSLSNPNASSYWKEFWAMN